MIDIKFISTRALNKEESDEIRKTLQNLPLKKQEEILGDIEQGLKDIERGIVLPMWVCQYFPSFIVSFLFWVLTKKAEFKEWLN